MRPHPFQPRTPNDAQTAPALRPGDVFHHTCHGGQFCRHLRRCVLGGLVGVLGEHLRPRQGRTAGPRRRGGLRRQRRTDPRRDAGGRAAAPARSRSARPPGQRHGARAGHPGAVSRGAPGACQTFRMRRTAPWLAACVLACTAPLQAAPRLQLRDGTLTPPQAAAAREILDEAMQRLPPSWADTLDPRIAIEWRDDLPPDVHGRVRGDRLLLRRALLDDWIARPDDAGNDEPATRAALAAVIHELAHVHDRSPQGRLSRDPRLLDLAGWQVGPMRFGLRLRRNAFADRSPDRYELESPAEFVAVNLEHFLLDPDYACRRPALHRYFAAHFRSAPP